MNFAFWFAPAAAFVICVAQSNLGRAAAAGARVGGLALLDRIRSLSGHGFAGQVIRAR
jgi:hypothetical protein